MYNVGDYVYIGNGKKVYKIYDLQYSRHQKGNIYFLEDLCGKPNALFYYDKHLKLAQVAFRQLSLYDFLDN